MAKKEEAKLLLKIKETGSGALNKTKLLVAGIGAAVVAAGAAVVGFVSKSISAYKEQERAVNSLNQSLVQQGIFTQDLSQEYQRNAAELQKLTTFGDEAIISAQAQIQGYIGQEKVTKDLTKAILDFATAQQIDLKSAADLVGKTIGSSTNALSRYGISIDSSATASEKLAIVTEELNTRFGGQSEAAAKGLGVLDQLSNTVGDLFEVFGQKFAPIIVLVAQNLNDLAVSAQKSGGFIDTMASIVGFLAQKLVVAKAAITIVGKLIGTTFTTAFKAAAKAIEGDFGGALDTIRAGAQKSREGVVETTQAMHQDLRDLNAAFNEEQQQNVEMQLEQSAANNELKRQQAYEARLAELEDVDNLNVAQLEKEVAHQRILADEEKRAELIRLNQIIKHSKDKEKVLEATRQKEALIAKETTAVKKDELANQIHLEEIFQDKRFKATQNGLGAISQLQRSKSKELAAIGKAAAVAQITIDTAMGASKAYNALAWIPIVGVALGLAAAGAVIAYGAERISDVVSAPTPMAEGGIVQATPGGTFAQLGEAGQDEAVIPLEDSGLPLGQSNINITVNGGLMGDAASAREFARSIDRELLRLREENEATSFTANV